MRHATILSYTEPLAVDYNSLVMILDLLLELQRTYVPLCMAVLYMYGLEKSKV